MLSSCRLFFLSVLLLGVTPSLAAGPIEPVAPPSVAPPEGVVQWVHNHAVDAGGPESQPTAAERRTIAHIVANARIIAMGESGHGNHEPLQYRNRLIRHLVQSEGLTAVALESGLAESKNLYDFVLGGPGDATILTRAGLTHGFGQIPENVALIEWIREHNRAHPSRPVHFYGIDNSTIQSAAPGTKGYGTILTQIETYLATTVPAVSGDERAFLNRFRARFTEVDYPQWNAADRLDAQKSLSSTVQLFKRHQSEMIRTSSRDNYEWALRMAVDAQRLPVLFASWVDDPAQLDRLFNLIELRDAAMADNSLWVLQREGPRGKVLLFQSNGHVTADTLVGSVMRWFPRQPKLTGILLRAKIGPRYRAIATVSNRGRPAVDSSLGSVDRAFAAAGRSPVLLDLHLPGQSPWWTRLQSASQGEHRVDDFVPTRAFDALLYIDRLSPLPPPGK